MCCLFIIVCVFARVSYDSVEWRNAPETIITAKNGTNITFKGKKNRNGKTDLKKRFSVNKSSRVNYTIEKP
jgi:hypothetical protein